MDVGRTIQSPSRPKVLVVEDSSAERSLFVDLIKQWGYDLTVASSGEQALALIQTEKIQLVLVDWELPDQQGIDLAVQVRDLSVDHYVYVILMSPQQAEEFLIRALQAGADDVLTKPIDTNELEARLHSAERRIELQATLAFQNNQLHEAYDLIAQDLRAVSKVQRSYLPAVQCPFNEMDYCWTSVPSQYVSGDHLHVFELAKGLFGFYLLDVSGHGIPAAVKSMQLVQMFSDQAPSSVVFQPPRKGKPKKQPASPRDVVARLNTIFQQTETDLSYFTLIYGHFEPAKNKVTFCQAGHPSPLILHANGKVTAVGKGGYPVGLFEFDEFEDETIMLNDGDAFFLYSDGVTEVLSETDEQFGELRLLKFVQNRDPDCSWGGLLDQLRHEIEQWGGEEVTQRGFEDDVSILLLSHRDRPIEPGEQAEQSVLLEEEDLDPVFVSSPVSDLNDLLPTNNGAEKSILIVDDSRSFLRIFEAMLTSWGYRVTAAQSAHQAIEIMSDFNPDFILTDWDMPGMSGIELCEHIRATGRENYSYIIMITGFASRDDLLRSLRVGADDFLTKPVNPSELKVRLKTAERISSLHSDLATKHREINRLYGSLQRDMREVARVQRALLPKNVESPWPVAVQGLFKPRGFVSGKHFGTLNTRVNELGFFMISLPGSDTSSALKAMSLARWFSIERAVRLLFPEEVSSVKMQRYLADPEVVWRNLQEITPAVAEEGLEFDLLYGLLNLDQGSLLVGGIGQWELVVAHPREKTKLVSSFKAESKPRKLSNGRYASVLYQDVIRPGSRVYVLPQTCADELNLAESQDWEERVLILNDDAVSINDELIRLSARVGSYAPKEFTQPAESESAPLKPWKDNQSAKGNG
ncbi:MAG: response regulator, partial [Limnobacter sp.]|nr:response regulator [Limnobacter sp.]